MVSVVVVRMREWVVPAVHLFCVKVIFVGIAVPKDEVTMRVGGNAANGEFGAVSCTPSLLRNSTVELSRVIAE